MLLLFVYLNILLLIWLTELVLTGFKVGFYFRSGIRVFRTEIPMIDPQDDQIKSITNILSNAANRDRWFPELVLFRKGHELFISHRVMEFSIFQFKRTIPMFHGKIVSDKESGKSSVTGYLNWSVPFIVLLPVVMLLFLIRLEIPVQELILSQLILWGMVITTLVVCARIEVSRYNKLVSHAREYYQRKTSLPDGE